MNSIIKEKLSKLPREPGVYFHKSSAGEIIYVGKAAVLNNRVRQYFHKSRPLDPKTETLISEIYDVDWIVVETELDALFLESEMIKRYKPRYNILLRDDKSQTYVRINLKEEVPYVSTTRQPIDDGAEYYGPYYNGLIVRKALRLLRKAFPYYTKPYTAKSDLDFHLGLTPGVEAGKLSAEEYKSDLRKLITYLKGNRKQLIRELESEMKEYSKSAEFEKAAHARDQLQSLNALRKQIVFSDKENMDLSKDHALSDLADLLGLHDRLGKVQPPRRIEGYDISHMSGTNNAASMVVFSNGVADKGAYRKFKLRLPGNDDFAHMQEVIERRFSESNLKKWPAPNLILIDGGRGQLSSVATILSSKSINIPVIGLSKQFEEIIVSKKWSSVNLKLDKVKELKGTVAETDDFYIVNLPSSSHAVKLLQRIRDESHRFAVSYHTYLKRTGQTRSLLDDIPGIGPATRKKLLKRFGSVMGVKQASEADLAVLVGEARAKLIKSRV